MVLFVFLNSSVFQASDILFVAQIKCGLLEVRLCAWVFQVARAESDFLADGERAAGRALESGYPPHMCTTDRLPGNSRILVLKYDSSFPYRTSIYGYKSQVAWKQQDSTPALYSAWEENDCKMCRHSGDI